MIAILTTDITKSFFQTKNPNSTATVGVAWVISSIKSSSSSSSSSFLSPPEI
jgi:hypothetical protein